MVRENKQTNKKNIASNIFITPSSFHTKRSYNAKVDMLQKKAFCQNTTQVAHVCPLWLIFWCWSLQWLSSWIIIIIFVDFNFTQTRCELALNMWNISSRWTIPVTTEHNGARNAGSHPRVLAQVFRTLRCSNRLPVVWALTLHAGRVYTNVRAEVFKVIPVCVFAHVNKCLSNWCKPFLWFASPVVCLNRV